MIDQDLAPVLKQYCLRQLRFGKAVSTSHIQMNIHATAAQQAHSSPASRCKSPRIHAACEVSKFWTLRAAQVPPQFWGLKPFGNRSFWLGELLTEFQQKSWFFFKILKFHHHGWIFGLAITFSKKKSGSSYLHHPKLRIKTSDWTKGKRKRSSKIRARAKKPPKNYK